MYYSALIYLYVYISISIITYVYYYLSINETEILFIYYKLWWCFFIYFTGFRSSMFLWHVLYFVKFSHVNFQISFRLIFKNTILWEWHSKLPKITEEKTVINKSEQEISRFSRMCIIYIYLYFLLFLFQNPSKWYFSFNLFFFNYPPFDCFLRNFQWATVFN